jgi:hypothetical protein
VNVRIWQGRLIKYWEAGYGKVLARFYSMLSFILMASTYLLVQGFQVGFMETFLVFLGMVVLVFVIGVIYVKTGFLKAEQGAFFNENPEFVSLRKELKEIKDLLKNG